MIEVMVPHNAKLHEKECVENLVDLLKNLGVDVECTLLDEPRTEALGFIKQANYSDEHTSFKMRCRADAREAFERGQWDKIVVCSVDEIKSYNKGLQKLRDERRTLREKIKQMENERIESKELQVVIDEKKIRESISFKLKSTSDRGEGVLYSL